MIAFGSSLVEEHWFDRVKIMGPVLKANFESAHNLS